MSQFPLLLSSLSYLSLHRVAGCDKDFVSDGDACADAYVEAINPHIAAKHIDAASANAFNLQLRDLDDATNWYQHWQDCRSSMETHVAYCEAIAPIEREECLCQLQADCDNLCDHEVGELYVSTTGMLLGKAVDYDYATRRDCQLIVDGVR